MRFATYRDTQRVVYFGGARYVVYAQAYPHTTWDADGQMVTRQGSSITVSITQGDGFTWHRYVQPDTEPAYEPPAPPVPGSPGSPFQWMSG